MRWRAVCRDVPEGEPILVSYGEQTVVALAFPPDRYFPDLTFMDARTFEILPIPAFWMRLPPRPEAKGAAAPALPVTRRAA
jgi:hypothetical protein